MEVLGDALVRKEDGGLNSEYKAKDHKNKDVVDVACQETEAISEDCNKDLEFLQTIVDKGTKAVAIIKNCVQTII